MSLEKEVFALVGTSFFLFEPQQEATVPLLLLLLITIHSDKESLPESNKWFIVILLLSGRWSY